MCDDVFSDDEETGSCPAPEENEWRRLKQARTADGFREGVERGENEKLQQGFNTGFCSAISHSFQIAKLRGSLTALMGINVTKQEPLFSKGVNEKLEDLLHEIVSLEALIISESGASISHNSNEESAQRPDCTNTDSCCGGDCKTDGTKVDAQKMDPVKSIDSAIFLKKISSLEQQYKELLHEAGIDL